MDNKKWVAVWGNATSHTGCAPASYGKDFTLRYAVRSAFDGSAVRLQFSNICGREPVTITRASVVHNGCIFSVSFNGTQSGTMAAGADIEADIIELDIKRGDDIFVNMYFGEYTDMRSGIFTTGPLERGIFSEGDFSSAVELAAEKSCSTDICWFLNTVSVLTAADKHAVVAFGDSITAQSWPDRLTLRLFDKDKDSVSIVRKGVSGARVLRQYDCVEYAGYGLSGISRFERDICLPGAECVIVLQGINDLIHPDPSGQNRYRPISDFPTANEIISAYRYYIGTARKHGMRIYFATLLPIEGWRTYAEFRDEVRNEINEWIRTNTEADGYIDFDEAVRNPENTRAMLACYDSGDHLHPSPDGAQALADSVPLELL